MSDFVKPKSFHITEETFLVLFRGSQQLLGVCMCVWLAKLTTAAQADVVTLTAVAAVIVREMKRWWGGGISYMVQNQKFKWAFDMSRSPSALSMLNSLICTWR